MDGKNRAASSYLSPGNPPADKEQNDPLAQVFHNACSYNFFAMAELLHLSLIHISEPTRPY